VLAPPSDVRLPAEGSRARFQIRKRSFFYLESIKVGEACLSRREQRKLVTCHNGDRLVERVEDRHVGGVAEWLGQAVEFVQVLSGNLRIRSLTNSPRLGQLLAGEGTAICRV
jgi:hypothetical protein